jgi:hypothetical protein
VLTSRRAEVSLLRKNGETSFFAATLRGHLEEKGRFLGRSTLL